MTYASQLRIENILRLIGQTRTLAAQRRDISRRLAKTVRMGIGINLKVAGQGFLSLAEKAANEIPGAHLFPAATLPDDIRVVADRLAIAVINDPGAYSY